MALTQMAVPIAYDIRIELYLISNGAVLLSPGFGFVTTYEDCPTGVSGWFDADGFSLQTKDDKEPQNYEWNTPYPYKNMPVLKEWLTQQKLLWP